MADFDKNELSKPLPLRPSVHHDAWGRRGPSFVQMLSGEPAGAEPYSELWIGAHPSAPAMVLSPNETALDRLLSEFSTDIMGSRLAASSLPLFKVLSIDPNQVLSIQLHPDAETARKLHAAHPDRFPDPFAKPEMALALSPLKLLYGFRRLAEISAELGRTPELAALVSGQLPAAAGSSPAQEAAAIKALYQSVLRTPPEIRREALLRLRKRLQTDTPAQRSEADRWLLGLFSIYGPAGTAAGQYGDAGLFCFYLMNIETLAAGDAIYIAPNVPHAYLSGELIECMQMSDNVIRAGLSPKRKDIELLINVVHTEPAALERLPARRSEQGGAIVTDYPIAADVPFNLRELRGQGTLRDVSVSASPHVLFCLEGSAEVHAGGVTLPAAPGDACLISVCAGSYEVALSGARIFQVSVPG